MKSTNAVEKMDVELGYIVELKSKEELLKEVEGNEKLTTIMKHMIDMYHCEEMGVKTNVKFEVVDIEHYYDLLMDCEDECSFDNSEEDCYNDVVGCYLLPYVDGISRCEEYNDIPNQFDLDEFCEKWEDEEVYVPIQFIKFVNDK